MGKVLALVSKRTKGLSPVDRAGHKNRLPDTTKHVEKT